MGDQWVISGCDQWIYLDIELELEANAFVTAEHFPRECEESTRRVTSHDETLEGNVLIARELVLWERS